MKVVSSYFLQPQLPKLTDELWNAYQPKINDEMQLLEAEELIEKSLEAIKNAPAQPVLGMKLKDNSGTAATSTIEEEEVEEEEEEEEEEIVEGDDIITAADRFTLVAALAAIDSSLAESIDTSIDATVLDSSIDGQAEVMDF